MTLADSNFWLALSLSKHDFHVAAREWLGGPRTQQPILFCRATQQSFLRLLTTDAVMKLYGVPPLSNTAAWNVYAGLRSDHRCGFAPEPDALETGWKRFSARSSASPKLWMDAYLAAFAVAGKYKLVTTDAAFKQFSGLDALILSKT